MSIALRQNITSGTADNFSEATLSGSLLVCVVQASYISDTGGGITFSAPTTSGFTWTLAASDTYEEVVSSHDGELLTYYNGGVAVYYIADASAMSDTTTTSVSATGGGGTPTTSFNMYEFTGVATSSPLDTDSGARNATGTSSTINPGSLTTTASDLIFVSCTDSGATHGTGFTSGVTDADQYRLNIAAGTIATAFGTSAGVWASVAVAFKSNSTSANADPSGVTSDFAVGSPSTSASSSVNASGVAADFTIGTALPGGGVSFAEPSGLSISSGIGAATAGVPINYGNVVSGSSGLPTGINTTYFYARWTGWLTVTVPGIYTLGLNVEDGGDFYIGTQPVVLSLAAMETANSSDAYTNSSTVELAANIPYPIVIEWQHGSGANYECQLLWTPPGGSVELIPTSNISLSGKWWNTTSGDPYPQAWY
jgi:hypothetical protein